MNYSEEEFLSVYRRRIDLTYRLCFSFLKNREDTEDAVQSVFIKYLSGGRRFENERHEKAWFIVTASNLCKDMLRQPWRRNVSLEDCDPVSDTDGEGKDDVYAAILNLPDKYKTVIYLYYYEGYKTREIAKMLHKPSSTIRNWLTEGRRYLKKMLGGISE
ncbi:MAG: RNA polymerase sigma factor [bacterium]|nr:RNA polymerase sigma factor [bacterium]